MIWIAWIIAALAIFAGAFVMLRTNSRYRDALEAIEFQATNHGGWFEQNPFGEYAKLGAIASTALK